MPPGSYSAVRFLITGGNGDSLVPLIFEYADGTQMTGERTRFNLLAATGIRAIGR